ncbi:MAG: radical SAM protein [Candidatus Omnitrophota bacterium]
MLEIKKPNGLVINVSDYCLNKCIFCFLSKRQKDPQELSIHEWKDFILSIRDWVERPFQISFTGGEPLLKDGIVELVEFVRQNGFESYITTSGSGLTSSMIRDLSDAGLDTITFSLETLDVKKHDSFRGSPGLFNNIMSGIDEIKQVFPQMKIGINTIIFKQNLDDILELSNWVLKNPKIAFIGFQVLMQPQNSSSDCLWFKKHEFGHLWPNDIEKIDAVLDRIAEMRLETQNTPGNKIGCSVVQLKAFKAYFRNPYNFVKEVNCVVFQKPISINPYGGIAVCDIGGELGNIRKESLMSMWNKKMPGYIDKILKCKIPCAFLINCYFWDACLSEDLIMQ